MFVQATIRDWMTTPAISISPAASIRRAHHLMKEFGIRHLPVVEQEHLVGILSLGDIREASPSDATTLSVWEMNYLWDKLTVERVMTTEVITAKPDDLMIEAVRTLLNKKISSLPIVDNEGYLVGIVTEVDIFRLVIAMTEQVAS
jgi:acetoin utilization protein AcuB